MKLTLYIDEIELCFKPSSIWMTLVLIVKFTINAIKEEWWFWTFFYPYEIFIPPMEEERKAGLEELERRMKKRKTWQ
ncbi:MAG: hypothetical protein Q8O55_11305 [Dehalococcoidales bacterium]|nr:hypothetical protein [Dehalococcoidales bacterium]